MRRGLSIFLSVILTISLLVGMSQTVSAEDVDITSASAVLMEVSTGEILYQKEQDAKRAPASVTKIMTMLLIFDALDEGRIRLEDTVTVSEYAASMGGSQVFLETSETQTVETMIKCISVASANDACVAMAEYVSGSEEAFVGEMNRRAKSLGMEHTVFKNCNGLDADGHVTSAKDIALMSRELLVCYPQIHDYCTIWMENITHTTRKGTSEFGLTNTNKLIRHYPYATGLKTGSTGQAKFCVSASAKKDGVELVAVIMGADSSKVRFQEATKLLNLGFSKCTKYVDDDRRTEGAAPVKGGVTTQVKGEMEQDFSYVNTTGANLSQISREIRYKKNVHAPVKKGDAIGTVVYRLEDKEIGTVPIIATEPVEQLSMSYALKKVLRIFGLSKR